MQPVLVLVQKVGAEDRHAQADKHDAYTQGVGVEEGREGLKPKQKKERREGWRAYPAQAYMHRHAARRRIVTQAHATCSHHNSNACMLTTRPALPHSACPRHPTALHSRPTQSAAPLQVKCMHACLSPCPVHPVTYLAPPAPLRRPGVGPRSTRGCSRTASGCLSPRSSHPLTRHPSTIAKTRW